MLLYAQEHFAPALQGGVNTGIGVEAGAVGPAELGQVYENVLPSGRAEGELVGALPVAEEVERRANEVIGSHATFPVLVLSSGVRANCFGMA